MSDTVYVRKTSNINIQKWRNQSSENERSTIFSDFYKALTDFVTIFVTSCFFERAISKVKSKF